MYSHLELPLLLLTFFSFLTVSPVKELELLVQALRLNTLSKLTFADSKRFDDLIHDVFPGVEFKSVEQQQLEDALKQVAKEMNLEIVLTQVTDIDMYMNMNMHMLSMIL